MHLPSRQQLCSSRGPRLTTRGRTAAGVGLSLKRAKQVKPDVMTLPRHVRVDAVRAAYGAAVAANLTPFAAAANWPEHHADAPVATAAVDAPTFSVDGLASTSNAGCKKSTLVLFINGRSAECGPLKAAVESAFGALHAKGAAFWVFVDARVPCGHVDVNVHPTKREVALLFQPELVEAVQAALEGALARCHDVRTFARAGGAARPITGGAPWRALCSDAVLLCDSKARCCQPDSKHCHASRCTDLSRYRHRIKIFTMQMLRAPASQQRWHSRILSAAARRRRQSAPRWAATTSSCAPTTGAARSRRSWRLLVPRAAREQAPAAAAARPRRRRSQVPPLHMPASFTRLHAWPCELVR
jgi:DNA mismatch repair protein, C-terminal domain